jgi:transcriptional regulator with XRE-family HTH domain
METGKIIAALRDKKGLSQTDLADQSDVSRVMIGKYERGDAVPSLDAAKRIADALEVSLDYLVAKVSTLNLISRHYVGCRILNSSRKKKRKCSSTSLIPTSGTRRHARHMHINLFTS